MKALLWLGLLQLASSCTSSPANPKIKRFAFPKGKAFVGDVKRPYERLGVVRTKVDYTTLDAAHDEDFLCKNYYNKAVADLVRRAKNHGADAVVKVETVVFYEGGTAQKFGTPQCSDEGDEGQVLAQGIAVKWKGPPVPDDNEGTGGWEKAGVPSAAAPAPQPHFDGDLEKEPETEPGAPAPPQAKDPRRGP